MIESITASSAFKLHQATIMVDRIADDYLRREHDIRYAPFLVLLMTRVLGRPSQQAIAAALDVSRASVTQRIAGLVESELVVVETDPTDSRANVVSLTDDGTRKADEAWRGLEAHQSGIEDGVDEAALVEQLDRIIANGTRILKP